MRCCLPTTSACLAAGAALCLMCATPARADAPCGGDCDGDGRVTISELTTGVGIALGAVDVARCVPCDGNRDFCVTVEELMVAVRGALHGCPPHPASTATSGAAASPTASARATDTIAPSPDTALPAADTATATAAPTDTVTAPGVPTPTGTAIATFSDSPAPSATPTATLAPATATMTAPSTASETPTATPTATAIWITPTATATVDPDPMSERCADPDRDVTAAANKIAAQTLRWLRDWANCLGRAGYAGTACDVRLDRGPNADTVRARTGRALINELVCTDARCTRELGRSLAHCTEKLTYQNVCSLADWENMWRWSGNPPLPLTGTCADASQAPCLHDADCAGSGCVAPSACDVHRYAPEAWEACRCIQEAFIKPQIDDWLAAVRTLPTAPSAACAAAAFNAMGEAIGPLIESGCLADTDNCRRPLTACARAWEAIAVRNHCGTCVLDAGGRCPAHCDGAGIPCETWMDWCATATARFDPLRHGTRGVAAP